MAFFLHFGLVFVFFEQCLKNLNNVQFLNGHSKAELSRTGLSSTKFNRQSWSRRNVSMVDTSPRRRFRQYSPLTDIIRSLLHGGKFER